MIKPEEKVLNNRGLARKIKLEDQNGNIKNMDKALLCDSVAT